MQIGQVPVQFVPEAEVNDTRSITLDPESGDVITPSLTATTRPGEVVPAMEEVDAAPIIAGTWLAGAAVLAVIWIFTRGK